jgi:NAD(P)-dependent dehydrogenase (short-subunit alcohol dehydrogenase family)
MPPVASNLQITTNYGSAVNARGQDPLRAAADLPIEATGTGAPGVLVYNASMLAPDSLLTSDVAHLHQAYDVDVAGAIVATQVVAPAMRAAASRRLINHARSRRELAGRPGGRSRWLAQSPEPGDRRSP